VTILSKCGKEKWNMASLSSAVGWRGAHVGAPTDPSAGGGERASLTTGERPWDRQRTSDTVLRLLNTGRLNAQKDWERLQYFFNSMLFDYSNTVVVTCSFGRHYSRTLSRADSGAVGRPTSDFLYIFFRLTVSREKNQRRAKAFEFGLKHFTERCGGWKRSALT